MRRAITAISYMLFGASILIFISALLIPVLKESPSQNEGDRAESYKTKNSGVSSSPMDVAEQAPIEQSTNSAVTNQNEFAAPEHPAEAPYTATSSSPDESATDHEQGTELTQSSQPVEASAPQTSTAALDNTTVQSQGNSTLMQPQQTVQPEATAPEMHEASQETVNPAAEAESRPAQTEPMSLLVLGEGYFSSGEVTPKANAHEAIDQIIPLIRTRPQDNVLVEGHADKIMSNRISPIQASKLNKTVSLRRAIAVAMVLEQKGVASDRIIVSGRGDSVPIASNLTEEGRAKNRRVEIKLTPAQ